MIVFNRLLAFAASLGLLAAGAVGAVEVAFALSGRRAWLVDRSLIDAQLSALTWSDQRVLRVTVGLLVVGFLIIAAQLKPRRPVTLPLPDGTPQRRARIERRGVEARLATLAQRDQDVTRAAVRMGRRRARVTTRAEHGVSLPEVGVRVGANLSRELERLGLAHKVTVKTSEAPEAPATLK